MRPRARRLLAYGIALGVIALDQFTKAWISRTIPPGGRIEILPIFNLTCLHNRGAAFSLLGDGGAAANTLFLVLAAAATVFFTVWIWRNGRRSGTLPPIALGLILGGTMGNGIDRIRHGYVVDFIQVHISGWYYPAFNVADSALTVGAVLLILAYLRPAPGEARTDH